MLTVRNYLIVHAAMLRAGENGRTGSTNGQRESSPHHTLIAIRRAFRVERYLPHPFDSHERLDNRSADLCKRTGAEDLCRAKKGHEKAASYAQYSVV